MPAKPMHPQSPAPVDTSAGCRRCGACCRAQGRTFWKAALAEEPHLWDRWPDLRARGQDGYFGADDWADCAMLISDRRGGALCEIELRYGRDAKPAVCRRYQCQGDPPC